MIPDHMMFDHLPEVHMMMMDYPGEQMMIMDHKMTEDMDHCRLAVLEVIKDHIMSHPPPGEQCDHGNMMTDSMSHYLPGVHMMITGHLGEHMNIMDQKMIEDMNHCQPAVLPVIKDNILPRCPPEEQKVITDQMMTGISAVVVAVCQYFK